MKISVLMPVYDTPLEWVIQAINSIINQTYKDFQFIIVDDNNPKGELTNYLYGIKKDCCLSIVRTKENAGIAAALDFGLSFCRNELIVRMDSDDIAHPQLLELHNDFFNQFPDRHICGIQIRLFNDHREWFSNHPFIITKEFARSEESGFWFCNHPGMAYRRDAIMKLGGYGKTPPTLAEDYALWIKFLNSGYLIYNRSVVLMDYRCHPKSFSFAPDRKAPEWYEFLNKQKQSLYD
jgi:glycosyltransferase involved in cell wall biosynthesis